MRAKGWWGFKTTIDHRTGRPVRARLGSPRRLKIIYEANMRAARAAGQWERAQRSKSVLPYFQYNLGPSEAHRPEHVNKQGLILAIDDPFWDAWYPPNGWGCKCWLRAITRSEAQRLGGVSQAPVVETVPFTNERRGTEEQIPLGIDPGWQTSPGKGRARHLTGRLAERLQAEGADNIRPVVAEIWDNGTTSALAEVSERIHIPVAVAPLLQELLQARSALVTVSSDTIRAKLKRHDHHEVAPVSLETFSHAQEIIDAPLRIEPDPRGGYRLWLVIAGRLHRLVIGKSAGGFLYIRTLFQQGKK